MRKSKRRAGSRSMAEMRRELTLLRLIRERIRTEDLQQEIARELQRRKRDVAYAQICKDYAALLHNRKMDRMELELLNADREAVGLAPLSKLTP